MMQEPSVRCSSAIRAISELSRAVQSLSRCWCLEDNFGKREPCRGSCRSQSLCDLAIPNTGVAKGVWSNFPKPQSPVSVR